MAPYAQMVQSGSIDMKKKTKISIHEFMAWLAGVEDIRGNGWSPDASQWKIIRNKIAQISLQPDQGQTVQLHNRAVDNTNPLEASEQIYWPTVPSVFEGASIVEQSALAAVKSSRGEEIAAAKRKRTQTPSPVREGVVPTAGVQKPPRMPRAAAGAPVVMPSANDAGIISVKPIPTDGDYSSTFV